MFTIVILIKASINKEYFRPYLCFLLSLLIDVCIDVENETFVFKAWGTRAKISELSTKSWEGNWGLGLRSQS